jgi:hypothetical protein
MSRLVAALVLAAALAGCSTLFPEFFGGSGGAKADASAGDGGSDGGGPPHIAGVVCIVHDVRDYRSCAVGAPGVLRITVEETRDVTMTDVAGHFSLPLAQALTSATVAAIDPRGVYAPSIIPLRLSNSATDSAALPIVEAQTLTNLALQNGQTLDPEQASLIAWVVDQSGAPVAGVTTPQRATLVEGGPNELQPGSTTGTHGTLALLQAPPTTVTLMLTPPPTLPLRADSYVLPLRAGALTVSTLVLLPR